MRMGSTGHLARMGKIKMDTTNVRKPSVVRLHADLDTDESTILKRILKETW
jgi:hypothetical protein